MVRNRIKKFMPQFPKRGEVWLINFDPTVGAEIKKTRPALILQNNVANRHSPITIVAAITSYKKGKVYPMEVTVHSPEGGLENQSLILLNQIRSIDKVRLIKKLGMIESNTTEKVNQAVQISLGLVDL